MSIQVGGSTAGLEREVAKISVRMDRIEKTTEKTLAIVQGYNDRFGSLEGRMDRLEDQVGEVLGLLKEQPWAAVWIEMIVPSGGVGKVPHREIIAAGQSREECEQNARKRLGIGPVESWPNEVSFEKLRP